MEGNDAARKFRSCLGTLLDAVLDIPSRQQIPRHLILNLVSLLIVGIKSNVPPPVALLLFNELVAKPFAEEWKLLKQDSIYVEDVLDVF